MFSTIFGISAGAALGALLRWVLGLWLNSPFFPLPLGTLAANLLGCFIMGLVMGVGEASPRFDPAWRTPLVTGFLGALTTFSTFSAEVTLLAQQGRPVWAALAVGAHVGGSLLMVLAGIACVALIRHLFA